MKNLALLVTTLFVSALIGVACGDDPMPTVSATVSPSTFVSGSTITLTVTTTDFEIRDPAGAAHQHLRVAEEGHGGHDDHSGHDSHETATAGHYHVYLDSTDVNPLRMGYEETIDLVVTATPGAHKLIIRLNDDSHAFLMPEVKTEVAITVE